MAKRTFALLSNEPDAPILPRLMRGKDIDEAKAKLEERLKKSRDTARKKATERTFEQNLTDFSDAMDALYDSLPMLYSILPAYADVEHGQKIRDFVVEKGAFVAKEENGEWYELSKENWAEIFPTVRDTVNVRETSEVQARACLISIVAIYDAFLSDLLRLVFIGNPSLISKKEETLTYDEILSSESIEQLQDRYLEKAADDILRESHFKQLEWLDKRQKIGILSSFKNIKEFVEICERRNLFTHTAGRVSRQYISTCRQFEIELGENFTLGSEAPCTYDYLLTACLTFYELGVRLSQLVWRKISKEELKAADELLNEIGYRQIEKDRFEFAISLLSFGCEDLKSHGSERSRQMMIVNLANAWRLSGEKDRAASVLDGQDWSASSDEFQLCVLAVREDYETLAKRISKYGENGPIKKADYRKWPVFRGIEKSDECCAAFRESFGEELTLDAPPAEELDTHSNESIH